MKTQISVIIPAHNEENYIGRCIASVKGADEVFPGNTEIIVVLLDELFYEYNK